MNIHHKTRLTLALVLLPLLLWYACKKDLSKSIPNAVMKTGALDSGTATAALESVVTAFQTTGDGTQKLQQQPAINFITYGAADPTTITVDENTTYQTMDGFGFMLTGGSATLLNNLGSSQASVLNELFGTSTGQIGISYLRISIGASDMSASDFTYDDVPGDTSLANFSINPDLVDLVPVLKKILVINPNIKILASPWTAPVWMKLATTGHNGFTGGTLNTGYYDVYAKYFVKYLQAMQAQGITIEAITPQNEPLNPGNDPSMLLDPVSEGLFIGNYLGPQIRAAGLSTKIICYDHNTDEVAYPLAVLANAAASPYIDGSGFHLYGAPTIGLMSTLHTAFPSKNLYFTEQAILSTGNFHDDLGWHTSNLILGAPNNWSRNVLEWVLATDPALGPHTPGGCTTCLGGITVDGTSVIRNVGYYIIGHASKFVRPGAVRINSNSAGSIATVAFKNSDGTKVLIAYNSGTSSQEFKVQWGAQSFNYTLPAGSVVTFKWAGTQLATPPGAPIGQTITLKGFNGQYVNGEGGAQPMWCNASSVTPAEQFLVVNAGGGQIALQSQGLYVSSQNGTQSMTCNSTSIGPAEKFTWIQNADGSISLQGNNGKYVSDEQGVIGLFGLGQIPMTCNRTTISAWEEFTVNQ